MLEDAIEFVEESAIYTFAFYRQIVKTLPIDVALVRIQEVHGSLFTWSKILLQGWWQLDSMDFIEYAVAFLGPVGLGSMITFVCGLSVTGIGLIPIALGALVGGAVVYGVYKYKEYQKRELLRALEIKKKEAELFFERWNQLDSKITVGDLFISLSYLKETKTSFHIVCEKIFPEVKFKYLTIDPDRLQNECYMCLEVLVSPEELENENQSKKHIIVDPTYVPQANDVVAPANCIHYIHKKCLDEWRISDSNQYKMHCSYCRQSYEEIHVLWISEEKKAQTRSRTKNKNKTHKQKFSMENEMEYSSIQKNKIPKQKEKKLQNVIYSI